MLNQHTLLCKDKRAHVLKKKYSGVHAGLMRNGYHCRVGRLNPTVYMNTLSLFFVFQVWRITFFPSFKTSAAVSVRGHT